MNKIQIDPRQCKLLIKKAAKYVKKLMGPLKSKGYYFHNWDHAKEVAKAADFYARKLNLPWQKRCQLILAALFHDVGFVKTYYGHEEASARIAYEFLKDKVPPSWLKNIVGMIRATKVWVKPKTLLEAALKDADVDNIRRADFLIKSDLLKKELEAVFWKTFSASDWVDTLQNALEIGQCRTPVCQKLKKRGLESNKSFVKLYGDFVKNQ